MRAPLDRHPTGAAPPRHGIAARLLPDEGAGFPIWIVDARQPPDDSALGLLSPAERSRAARFRTRALHDRYVAAHAGVRLLAEYRFGIPAARQHWENDPLGKPLLADVPSAHCSISYSGAHALLAWSEEGEIGVDLETVRAIADSPELAGTHYTRRERAALRRLDPASPAFALAFLTVWVRKEACVKAIGLGLSLPLDTVHCGVGRRPRPVRLGDCLLSTGVLNTSCGHVAAWARRSGSPGAWEVGSSERPGARAAAQCG